METSLKDWNWRTLTVYVQSVIPIWTLPFCFFFQIDGITIGSLDDVPSGPVTSFFKSVRNTLDFDFQEDNEG